MVDLTLTKTRIQAGFWEGVLTSDGEENVQPELDVTHLGQTLAGVEIRENPDRQGEWFVRVPIPANLLGDGVQSFVMTDRASGEMLGNFTIVTGHPVEEDISAEMDLLRAELDMLKRAFRRHCLETM